MTSDIPTQFVYSAQTTSVCTSSFSCGSYLILSLCGKDYPIICWACHRLLAIPSPANPSYTSSELLHQLELSKSTLIIAHSSTLKTALAASAQAGLTPDRIILVDPLPSSDLESDYRYPTVDELIQDGLVNKPSFVERHLNAGESRSKLSFLCFSSGTTGKPKACIQTLLLRNITNASQAVAIPHSSSVTNVIQFSEFYRTKNHDVPDENKFFKPGDKALAGVFRDRLNHFIQYINNHYQVLPLYRELLDYTFLQVHS